MRTLVIAALLFMVSCSTDSSMTVSTDQNPVSAEWTGPYGGVPAFDQVEVRAGEGTFTLHGALSTEADRADSEVTFMARGPDLSVFDRLAEMLRADAPDAVVGRIKGEMLRLAGHGDEARNTLIAPYVRGERDPRASRYRRRGTNRRSP